LAKGNVAAKDYCPELTRGQTVVSHKLPSSHIRQFFEMRWFSFFLFSALWSLSLALSSSGSRLLVINEEKSEQDKYSQLWKDLKGAFDDMTTQFYRRKLTLLLSQSEDSPSPSNRPKRRA
jgi:hypothetical protein